MLSREKKERFKLVSKDDTYNIALHSHVEQNLAPGTYGAFYGALRTEFCKCQSCKSWWNSNQCMAELVNYEYRLRAGLPEMHYGLLIRS